MRLHVRVVRCGEHFAQLGDGVVVPLLYQGAIAVAQEALDRHDLAVPSVGGSTVVTDFLELLIQSAIELRDIRTGHLQFRLTQK